ncbi:bifunctional germination protease/germinant receptor pseudoprotease CspBA [Terrisporobacter sp.]
MINIDYEVIVKYNGDILQLEEELDVNVEILSPIYAIITADSPEKIDNLLNYSQIEYVEKPFILETQDTQSFSSTGITNFKNRSNLTGRGTIIGLIDSGIDYTLPIFKNSEGKSRILYYWDQSIEGNPPEGFREGSLYNNEDINRAINGEINIPISNTAAHGTHVAGICSEIANEASLIVVRVGRRQTDYYSRSTEFMRAIKFILDRALELKMPVVINVSYGSNEGSHTGQSLFEEYIDDMCLYWKNNIVVAAGNNRSKGGHKQIRLDNIIEEVEFVIGEGERIININIWPNFADDFSVYLVNPSNQRTQSISLTSGEIRNSIGVTRIKGYFYPVAPYSLQRRITFQLTTDSQITSGIWKIVFEPNEIVDGRISIYLPTSEGLSKDTRFLSPTTQRTVTVPGTSRRVITVGSYNSKNDIVSIFSGEGDTDACVFKPDILAPGEDILSYLPGGNQGILSGTSMAAPHVTGVCALFLQWGVVNGNDQFLYSAKLKALLLKSARRLTDFVFPNNRYGYGYLNLLTLELDEIADINTEMDYFYRKKKRRLRYRNDEISLNLFRQNNIRFGINVLFTPGFEESLTQYGNSIEFYKISDNFGIVFINEYSSDLVKSILSNEFIDRQDQLIRISILGNIVQGTTGGVNANEEIGVNFFKNNPSINLTGRGVIISIVSSGIDYLHPDFIYPDGTSKILYLWDQTKEGNPPEGYYIGTEYTREDINEAIRNNDSTLSTDEEGYGTILAGICAGLGNVTPEYAGVAEDAELIVVKMNKIDGFYSNAMQYSGQEYAYRKALEINRAIVLNYLVGSNSQVGITYRDILRIKPFYTRGVCLVSAAGNEGNTQTHARGVLESSGDIQDIDLEVGSYIESIDIQIWLNRPDTAEVAIVSPTGEVSKIIAVTDYNNITGRFNFENTSYIINYIYPTTYSGQQLTTINLLNVAAGTWKIRLIGDYITNGIYNIYLPNRVFINEDVKFSSPDQNYTINYPSTYNDTISVGAYNTISRGLWPGSSRGLSISGLQKPDIVAPGVNIIGPYPGGGYATITGTAPAACYTSGAVAMFMQYILNENTYVKTAFVQKIRTLLSAGATRTDGIIYPNVETGYGLLNLRRTFEVFR